MPTGRASCWAALSVVDVVLKKKVLSARKARKPRSRPESSAVVSRGGRNGSADGPSSRSEEGDGPAGTSLSRTSRRVGQRGSSCPGDMVSSSLRSLDSRYRRIRPGARGAPSPSMAQSKPERSRIFKVRRRSAEPTASPSTGGALSPTREPVGLQANRRQVGLDQPDAPMTIVVDQFGVLVLAHVTRPDHLGSRDVRRV